MLASLPVPLQSWVRRQAEEMGLPGPESYIELLVRLEKQRQDLKSFESVPTSSNVA
jgi:hypothetical protein